MFFRRERVKEPVVADGIANLRTGGFMVTPVAGGIQRVSRSNCAIDLKEEAGRLQPVGRAGITMNAEIGSLVDGGFQKFFRTPSGRQKPALSEELKALHDFEEDLKEALALKSLYNESLGTVSTFYMYDRVKDRDRGVPKRVWDK